MDNEALQVVDCAIAPCVEAVGINAPPAAPGVGLAWVIGPIPTGEWAGKAGHVATMSAAGWRFIAPFDGLSAIIRTSGLRAEYRMGAWEEGILRADRLEIDGQQVVSSRAAAIASPAGGATIDGEARAAIEQILVALRHHGLITS